MLFGISGIRSLTFAAALIGIGALLAGAAAAQTSSANSLEPQVRSVQPDRIVKPNGEPKALVAGPELKEAVNLLTAGQGVTAISGQVVNTDGFPLQGVSVSDGDAASVTDALGRYILPGVKVGDSVMSIDARLSGPDGRTDYGYYLIKVTANEGVTNVLPYKHWLPKIDHAHDVAIPSPTISEVVVTNPDLPGIEIHIPAGTVITGADHKPVTNVSLTPMPSGLSSKDSASVKPCSANFDAE